MGIDLVVRKICLTPFLPVLSPFLLVVFLAAGATAADEKRVSPITAVDRVTAAEQRRVVAYSFHGTLRCMTCLLVERGAEEAVRGDFPGELRDGSLSWHSVNIRLPENQHFAREYQLGSWGLVLVEYRGERPGKWRKLPLVGELVHGDPDIFRRFVAAEVRAFLNDGQEMTEESR